MTPAQHIGRRVRRYRLKRGWTQTDLGRRIGGWHKNRVCRLETGRLAGITVHTLFRLARALRVSPVALIRGIPTAS